MHYRYITQADVNETITRLVRDYEIKHVEMTALGYAHPAPMNERYNQEAELLASVIEKLADIGQTQPQSPEDDEQETVGAASSSGLEEEMEGEENDDERD